MARHQAEERSHVDKRVDVVSGQSRVKSSADTSKIDKMVEAVSPPVLDPNWGCFPVVAAFFLFIVEFEGRERWWEYYSIKRN